MSEDELRKRARDYAANARMRPYIQAMMEGQQQQDLQEVQNRKFNELNRDPIADAFTTGALAERKRVIEEAERFLVSMHGVGPHPPRQWELYNRLVLWLKEKFPLTG